MTKKHILKNYKGGKIAMGMIEDITKAIRKGPEIVNQINSVKLNTKSIARGAKDSTFQFPCLIVDSAPTDMASTIARTLDQVYATFTQTWLSMNSMFDITIDPTPLDYLRKMHQNLKLESVDDLIVDADNVDKYMEKVYDGSYRLYMNPEKTCGVVFNVADRATKEMMESHRELLKEHMSDFDLRPLETFQEAEEPSAYDLAKAVIDGQASRNANDKRNTVLSQTDRVQAPKLLDRDIKRNNDMVPYGIQIRLIAVNDKKEFVQYVDFIVGVKTVLHLIQSQDMIENIARTMQNKSLSFKFLRWTTGEISLIKDIILNISDMKADAVNRSSGKSPFFSTLKRLKNQKIGLRNLTVPHAIIPNATIVITTYEADYLQNNYAINVRDDSVAKKIISNMFLMSFIIMDEGTGTISVMYDGDSTYQTYSLETLERDNSLNSNKLGREIGRMISH
jgi:hypothetical protein